MYIAGLMQLFQTVQEMQEQLKKVHETALQLAAEKEDRQHHINVMINSIFAIQMQFHSSLVATSLKFAPQLNWFIVFLGSFRTDRTAEDH